MLVLHRDEGLELAHASPPGGAFPRHSHHEYVVSVNVTGVERVRLDATSFDVGTDEVTVYNPGQVQSCTTAAPPGRTWSCLSLYAAPETVEAVTGRRPGHAARPVVVSPRLRGRLLAAGRDARLGEAVDERLVVLLLDVLDAAGAPAAPAPGIDDPRIKTVVDRLRGDLTRRVPLTELAAQTGLSREELIRGFRRATGHPPHAYHLQARLAEGRRLVRSGVGIAEAAARTGFADQAHFTRRFRAAYAATPGAARRAA